MEVVKECIELKDKLSKAQIDQLLNEKKIENGRKATENEAKLIRERLVQLKDKEMNTLITLLDNGKAERMD